MPGRERGLMELVEFAPVVNPVKRKLDAGAVATTTIVRSSRGTEITRIARSNRLR
jgi:hypothetical protein